MWIAGLTALISAGKGGRSKIDGWNEEGFSFQVRLATGLYHVLENLVALYFPARLV